MEEASKQQKKEITHVERTQQTEISRRRQKRWFEKFDWFVSSEDYLVLGGKSGEQNELLVKKYLRPRIQATNADRCVGRTGVVLEDIDNLAATGQVRVCGSVWSARSTDGASIAAGTTVVVDRIEGVKLMVRPAKAPVGKV